MTELVDVLTDRNANTKHERFMLGDISYVNNKIVHGDTEYTVSDHAFDQICDVLSIPKAYAERCPEDIKNTTINYWLTLRSEVMWSGLFEGNHIRSLMNPSYVYVPSIQIYEAVNNTLKGDLDVSKWVMHKDALEYVGFSSLYDTHVVDSPVRAGLRVVYSDSWSVAPKFDSYLCRIACFNSAITPIANKKFRVNGKSSIEIVQQCVEYIDTAIAQIQPMIDGFAELANQEITNFISLIARICSENGLPNKIRELIIASVDNQQYQSTVSGEMRTMYDVINLITWVASHSDITDEHKEHLFAIAGSVMVHNTIRCDSCGGSID